MTDVKQRGRFEVRDAQLVLEVQLTTAMGWLAVMFAIAVALGIGVYRLFTLCTCG